MKKFKLFFNIVEEEQWLNEQLQKGYRCTNISGLGIYTFEKANKASIIRLDYQDYLSANRFEEYKTIYEDFGWTHIRGSRFGSIQYWQKTADSQNEIFSDRQSYVHYYKRLMNYSLSLAISLLMISYMIYKDSSLYETKGLWDMEGSLFWKAFLFETPFVIIKLLPLIMVILFGFSYLHAYRQYSLLKDK
ncbi:DUF2812 domain-containing protein [Aquibacillus kalidii]|uniref:DUF2812 domain-containing protein n=1 Tax=Aquibacillus kalidii TaxID=2762597 RepID=UPI00164524FB|nr:DUF2812 domain-containing protein [Aquibacillus kalidii]